ncbi:SRPBCC family protein [Sphingomonas sp. M1-B02]|uniref:SRPBCC family protein n=1 Tax=Sphingomonas sp. M1-B02 TaxID=3114300 RepID=UPI0022402225|nr:SRPBCC family protein [Sphingomonas sp. S6-11]UZK66847.1 SRPBCC family protein [Sphingomonas sp. S6-11]
MSDVRDDAPSYVSKDGDIQKSEAQGGEGTVWGRTVSINRSRAELYAYWRDFGNLATFMFNVEDITVLDDKRSHWKVKGPNGTYEWDSVVTEDVPGELIAWEADGDVKNSGRIEFRDGPAGHGTFVRAVMAYDPPAGVIGKLIATFTQKEPQIQSMRDLRRFKQVMEAGEIATTTPPNREPAS